MGRTTRLGMTMAVASVALAAGDAAAAVDSDYDRDVISVVTLVRHAAYPSATCLVWANAEGLGVGPAQLDGYHGLSFNINPQPLPNEAAKLPTTFAQGLADLKARFPKAPGLAGGRDREAPPGDRGRLPPGPADAAHPLQADGEGPGRLGPIRARKPAATSATRRRCRSGRWLQ